MDTLHGVLRSIRGETKSRRDHLDRATPGGKGRTYKFWRSSDGNEYVQHVGSR